MELLLKRTILTPNSTIGDLFIDGERFCYTLEDMVRPEGVKIPGKTAIPEGRYLVDVTYSQRFKKLMPVLVNVPNFEGVRIHPGNSAKDTEGCILVGNIKGVDYISESRLAYDVLFKKINLVRAKGEEVHLEITHV